MPSLLQMKSGEEKPPGHCQNETPAPWLSQRGESDSACQDKEGSGQGGGSSEGPGLPQRLKQSREVAINMRGEGLSN